MRRYAQLKSVRLPKKFPGGHHGFAFIELLMHQEAKQAKERLAHMYSLV
jgi:hypothetical protein